jgi:hypothetical protein
MFNEVHVCDKYIMFPNFSLKLRRPVIPMLEEEVIF